MTNDQIDAALKLCEMFGEMLKARKANGARTEEFARAALGGWPEALLQLKALQDEVLDDLAEGEGEGKTDT